jgi:hypothetical protein
MWFIIKRRFCVLPLALPAAVSDQPTLPAFEESLIERIFEHVAIGTHLFLCEIRGLDILFVLIQKVFGYLLVVIRP